MLLHNHPGFRSTFPVHVDKMRLIMTQNLSPRTEPRSQANDFPSSPPSLSFAARLPLPRVHYGLVPLAYLSKMAESTLAARAKIRPPCTLKHRVQ